MSAFSVLTIAICKKIRNRVGTLEIPQVRFVVWKKYLNVWYEHFQTIAVYFIFWNHEIKIKPVLFHPTFLVLCFIYLVFSYINHRVIKLLFVKNKLIKVVVVNGAINTSPPISDAFGHIIFRLFNISKKKWLASSI